MSLWRSLWRGVWSAESPRLHDEPAVQEMRDSEKRARASALFITRDLRLGNLAQLEQRLKASVGER